MTASDKWEAWIAKVAATIDRPTLVRAARLRDERATWDQIRAATGTKHQSSVWFRAWEKAGIEHRPARPTGGRNT